MYHSKVEVPALSTKSTGHKHCLRVSPWLAGEVAEHAAGGLKQLHTGAIGVRLDHNMGVKLLQDTAGDDEWVNPRLL